MVKPSGSGVMSLERLPLEHEMVPVPNPSEIAWNTGSGLLSEVGRRLNVIMAP